MDTIKNRIVECSNASILNNDNSVNVCVSFQVYDTTDTFESDRRVFNNHLSISSNIQQTQYNQQNVYFVIKLKRFYDSLYTLLVWNVCFLSETGFWFHNRWLNFIFDIYDFILVKIINPFVSVMASSSEILFYQKCMYVFM